MHYLSWDMKCLFINVLIFIHTAMSGAVEHGTQYQMTLAYEHKLQRTAYNFCFGPFGQVKGNHGDITS